MKELRPSSTFPPLGDKRYPGWLRQQTEWLYSHEQWMSFFCQAFGIGLMAWTFGKQIIRFGQRGVIMNINDKASFVMMSTLLAVGLGWLFGRVIFRILFSWEIARRRQNIINSAKGRWDDAWQVLETAARLVEAKQPELSNFLLAIRSEIFQEKTSERSP